MMNKIKTAIFGFMVLLLGGLIQFSVAVWQLKNTQPGLDISVALFSSILIMITNLLLEELLVWATKKEGNLSKSKYNASLNIKVCLFQFFNAGVFYALSNVMAIWVTTHNNMR